MYVSPLRVQDTPLKIVAEDGDGDDPTPPLSLSKFDNKQLGGSGGGGAGNNGSGSSGGVRMARQDSAAGAAAAAAGVALALQQQPHR